MRAVTSHYAMLDTYHDTKKNQVAAMKSASKMFSQINGREPAQSYMVKKKTIRAQSDMDSFMGE